MNDDARPAAMRARELREAFDAIFAQPPPPPPPATTALLILRAGGERVAVKRSEMGGLVRAENIAPVPGRSPAFLGLAGLQGELCPVWRLAALLGGGGGSVSAPGGDAGWLVLADGRAETPCAFVCEAFERLVFVSESALSAPSQRDARPGLVQALMSWEGALIPVVDLPALQAEIQHRRKSSNSSIS